MSDQPDLFDVDVSRAKRDEGMARVAERDQDFKTQFARHIDLLPHGWIGTCEDIRRDWKGIVPHPNAWGACWNAAVRRELLIQLPEQVHMTASKSHARKTHLFRRA